MNLSANKFEIVFFSIDDDCFSPIYELGSFKLLFVLLMLALTLILIPVEAVIVAHEWLELDQFRGIINHLVSSLALTNIGHLILVQIPEILRYLVGPFPDTFCFFHYVLKNTFALQQLLFIDMILVMRYLFVFHFISPALFQDEFWIFFVNVFVVTYSFFSQLLFAYMPGRQPMIYYFCSGKNPHNNFDMNTKVNVIMLTCQVLSAVLLTFIIFKIKIFKMKNPAKKLVRLTKPKVKNKAVRSLLFNAFIAVMIAEVTFVINKINATSPIDNTFYPNYIFVNIFQLVNPLVTIGGGTLIYFYKNTHIWAITLRELNDNIST